MEGLDLQILSYSLEDILGNIDVIETQIQNRVYAEAVAVLDPVKQAKGDIVLLGGRPFRICMDTSRRSRSMNFSLLSTIDHNQGLATGSTDIREVGLIRTVTVALPASIRRSPKPLLHRLAEVLRRDYASLEYAFLREYRKSQMILEEGLDSILRVGYYTKTQKPLPNRCFLSVTSLSSGRYEYHFSYNNVVEVLSALKIRDLPTISPIGVAATLINGEAVDSFVAHGVLSQSRFNLLPFTSMSYLTDNPDLWSAERILFDEPSLAVREVCRVENYSLQVNAPPRIFKPLERVIDSIQRSLEERFRNNLNQYTKSRGLLRGLREKTARGALATVKDFAENIAAKTLAELIKSG